MTYFENEVTGFQLPPVQPKMTEPTQEEIKELWEQKEPCPEYHLVCSKCGGTGRITNKMNWNQDCPECNGTGKIT